MVNLQYCNNTVNNNDAKYCQNKFVEYFIDKERIEWEDDSVQKTYFG